MEVIFWFIYIISFVFIQSTHPANECLFGRNPRSFDILTTSDCSCNNYNVQFKLIQIANDYLYAVGVLSANRMHSKLRMKSINKFRYFVQNFFDDDLFYQTALATNSISWNSLHEYLFGAPSFVDIVTGSDTTAMPTTPNLVIRDCKFDKNDEIVTLNGVFIHAQRPNDEGLTDSFQRMAVTFQFRKNHKDNTYLMIKAIFKGILFSIDNAKKREGADTHIPIFDDFC